MIDSLLLSLEEWSYFNADMRKFESSHKEESRTQSADSSKAYRKRRAFYCLRFLQDLIVWQKCRETETTKTEKFRDRNGETETAKTSGVIDGEQRGEPPPM